MGSLEDITTADVRDSDPVTADIDTNLAKVRRVMEEHRLRALPVLEDGQFAGMLGYRDVMEKLRSDPTTTAVEPLLHTPPEVADEDTVVELAELRVNSGRKKAVMLDDDGHLTGVVDEADIVFGSRDADELAGLKVGQVMTQDLVTIDEDEPFETARKRMRDRNISRLVVLDDGELSGVISSLDTLRAMVPRDQMSGGTGKQGDQRGALGGSGDRKGEKESMSDIPVRELMQPTAEIDATILEGGNTSLRSAIDILRENDALELVVVDGDEPSGLLTLKDVIDVIRAHGAVESLLVQLTGPEVPEEKAAIHNKIETQIRGGLGRVLQRPEELRVHMKKYEQDGDRHKYTLNFHLSSELGTTRVNTHGWDLLDAVDEGLETLERLVKEEKGKMRDTRRSRERKGKYNRSS